VRATARPRPPRRFPALVAAVVPAAALAATLASPVATGADTVSDKQAEAARLREAVDAQAERIADADRALRLARSDQQDADAEVLAAAVRLDAAQDALAVARRRLAARAVSAYVHGGRVSLVDHIAGSNGADLELRRHYIDTAARFDRDAINALQRTEDALVEAEQRLLDARDAARRSTGRVRANLDVVASTEATQRANLRRVEGELGVLVRRQQQREFAAALRRAQQAAARARPSPQSPIVLPAPPAPFPPGPTPTPPGGIWACIREKESGNNYRAPGGGAYQFALSTWLSLGGTGLPEHAPPALQDAMAITLQQRSGWSQWSTAKACGAY
jgi:hypothetical protein